jgi:hypothetical protein
VEQCLLGEKALADGVGVFIPDSVDARDFIVRIDFVLFDADIGV